MKKIAYKILTFVSSLVILIFLYNHYNLSEYLSLTGFNKYHEIILNFARHYPDEFVISYICIYIVLIAACIPGTILLDLIAGFIYGPYVGTILVVLSYLCGAVINFSLVRFLFKDIFHRKFAHLRYIIFSEESYSRTILNLIGLRFIPVIPFWLLNILSAILEIRLIIFVITTFLGIIPTSIIYVVIGNTVRNEFANNQQLTTDILTNPKLWLPLLLLILPIVFLNIYKFFNKSKQTNN